jgi:hypothetical protein
LTLPPVHKKTNPAFNDIEPLVFAFVVMRLRPAARRSHIEKGRALPAGLFAVEQDGYCVVKCMQHAAFVGSYQERTAEQFFRMGSLLHARLAGLNHGGAFNRFPQTALRQEKRSSYVQ